jgi:diaminopimelate decarboxylase
MLSAGAYGSVMACNYNSRALTAEVLVNGRQADLVRERQPLDDIWQLESIPARLKNTKAQRS